MSDIAIPRLMDVARRVAANAAEFLEKEYERIHTKGEFLHIQTKESPIDLVTEVDGKAQELIIREIQSEFPDHRFFAEESGASSLGDPKSPYEWIIDPLDGTVNFVHGRRTFGTIVALRKDGEVVAGAMSLPLRQLEFYGSRGGGAFVNGRAVKLRETKSMNDAVLSCNIMRRAKDIGGTLYVTVPACASVENYGCAAQEIGEVLLGTNDGVFYDGIRLWDIALGFLLIEEAGGKSRMDPLDPTDPRKGFKAAASTTPIFEELWGWVERKM